MTDADAIAFATTLTPSFSATDPVALAFAVALPVPVHVVLAFALTSDVLIILKIPASVSRVGVVVGVPSGRVYEIAILSVELATA